MNVLILISMNVTKMQPASIHTSNSIMATIALAMRDTPEAEEHATVRPINIFQ